MQFWIEPDDAGKSELGVGMLVETSDSFPLPNLHMGYQVADRVLLRLRERFVAREVEVGFAIATASINFYLAGPIRFRAQLMALGGGGITNDRDGIGHVGFALRTLPIYGVDWVTIEAGVRESLVQPSTQGSIAISLSH